MSATRRSGSRSRRGSLCEPCADPGCQPIALAGGRHLQQPRRAREIAVADLRRVVRLPVGVVALAAGHQHARVLGIRLPVGIGIEARERRRIAAVRGQPLRDASPEMRGEQRRLPQPGLLQPVQHRVGVARDLFLERPPDPQRHLLVRQVFGAAYQFLQDRACHPWLEARRRVRQLAPDFGDPARLRASATSFSRSAGCIGVAGGSRRTAHRRTAASP